MVKERASREKSQENQPPPFAAGHLAALLESTQDLIWSVDLNYRLVTFNKALSDAFARGFGAKIAAGMTPRDLLQPEKAAVFPPLYEKALSEGPCSAEYRLKDGRYLEMTFSPIMQDGRKVGVSVFGKDVTRQKSAQEALRRTAEQYREFFEFAPEAIFRTTKEARTIAINLAGAKLLGYDSPGEAISCLDGRKHQAFFDLAERAAFLEELNEKGKARSGPSRFKRKDGTLFWGIMTARNIRGPDGETLYYQGFMEDITDQKLLEEKLRDSEESYRATFEQVAVGIVLTSLEGTFLRCNTRFAEIVGYAQDEIPGMTFQQITAPEDLATSLAFSPQMTDGQIGSAAWEKRYVRKDGNYTWARITVSLQCDMAGRPIHRIAVVEDINARKAAEKGLADAQETLRVSEERYRTIFQSSLVMTAVTQVEGGIIVDINKTFLDTMGFESAEVIGHTTFELNFWTDLRDRDRFVELLQQRAEFQNFETWLRKKSGAVIPVLLSASVIHIGGVACALTVMRDVSEMRAAEEALRKTEKKFREIFEDAPEGIFQTTRDGRLLALNPSGAKLLGFSSSGDAVASIKDSAHDVWLNPEDRARYTQLLEEQGEIRDYSCQFKRTDGTPLWVSLTTRKVCWQDGQTLYYQGFMEDMTEQKALELDLKAKVRELNVLSEIDSALLHAKTEKELLTEYCRIVVEVGGYRMAWVGFAEEGPEKRVIPVAHYGHEDGYLKIVNVTWADTERGQGPTGRCIRTGEIAVARDIAADPTTALWQKEAAKRGYMSSIAIPLRQSEGDRACLTAYGVRVSLWSDAERRLMDQVASALGFGIKTLRTTLAKAQYQESLSASLEQTIEVIAETVDQRDPYTAGHQRRVTDLCVAIAGKLGLSSERTQGLRLAASIHDLGKIGIPAEILAKPGALTENQYTLLKEHVQLGYEILKNVQFPWPIAPMIHQHHERLDGSGYPRGLKAEAIFLESRILAVADVVEAMSSHRPYRASRGIDEALDEVLSKKDTLYDAEAVEACVNLFRREGYQFPSP